MQSGGYTAIRSPGAPSWRSAQILNGMTPDSPPAEDKKRCRSRGIGPTAGASGKQGRVFTTTHGASEDLLNDGFRRMAVNATLVGRGARVGDPP